jgi:hypothetical protein
VYTEERTVLRTVVTDFSFNYCLEIRSDNRIRHEPRCVHCHSQRCDVNWKRSRISVFEVEAIPHSCIPLDLMGMSTSLYTRSVLLVGSFDLRKI